MSNLTNFNQMPIDQTAEKVFYSKGSALVTSSRVQVGEKTYAVRHITSVRLRKGGGGCASIFARGFTALVLYLIALPILNFNVFTLFAGSIGLGVMVNALYTLIFGLTYHVDIMTPSSSNVNPLNIGFMSKSEAEAATFLKAVQDAMASR